MKLEKLIEEKIAAEEMDKNKPQLLWNAVKKFEADCVNHLGQISAQMPNYDIHDERHSQKVLENVEALLGEKATQLSFYELILLHSSCYLHDAAMALPVWEYDLLRSVEGNDAVFDNTVKFQIRNDFKPPQTLAELKNFVVLNKSDLYGDFTKVADFIFSPDDEDTFQLDLARRAQNYELFRNEYAEQLESRSDDLQKYLDLSQSLRIEFIRKTHHMRVTDYVENLKYLLIDPIGTAASARFLDDLSAICRSHGEGSEFIGDMSVNSHIEQIGEANLQFIAVLLRLGDIIHFSADRAPSSLLSEKRILDKTSRIHWETKLNDTHYQILKQNGKTVIKFSAYCAEPSEYYFLCQYLDWIDEEIEYYFSFFHSLEYCKVDNIAKYDLQLCDRVDRSDVIADKTKFIPDHTAKFTMDQSKILDLLMGTQLYKDKYLCLRELYQNALDTSKCMKARDMNQGIRTTYRITFGLDIDSKGQKYVYCLDQGTGMTKDIVKNYFLRIGNSYYKSHEFIRDNVTWKNKVCPTSQFGIGVLSCFMLGEKLEVTTKHVDSAEGAFAFCLEAKSERFYYIPVNPLDEERVGTHGTLIKIFLYEEEAEKIHNELPKDYIYQIYSNESHRSLQNTNDQLINSIYYQVNRQIAICPPEIEVVVCVQGHDVPIIPRTEIFDYRKPDVDLEKLESIWSEYHFMDGTVNPYKDVVECRNYIKNIPIHINEDGIELDTFISLPMKGIPVKSKYIFSFEQYTWGRHNPQIFVDGITMSESRGIDEVEYSFGLKLWQSGNILLNFTGKVRPILSVDRNSIIQYPKEALQICEKIVEKLIVAVVKTFTTHLEQEHIAVDSDEANLAFDLIYERYSDFSGKLLQLLQQSTFGNSNLQAIKGSLSENVSTINDAIKAESFTIKDIDMLSLKSVVHELVIGKMIPATKVELQDHNLMVTSSSFDPPSDIFNEYQKSHHSLEYVIKADSWTGIFADYDIVNQVWPVVPERVFNKISLFDEGKIPGFNEKQNRIKIISNAGNGLQGIAKIEPAMVNPKFGISAHKKDPFTKQRCLIGTCEQVLNGFWLFELNQHGELRRKENIDYALYVYIAPKKLSDVDENVLQDYIGIDDVYVQGVKEGWSILFLGYDQKYYILPGIHEKQNLIELIPPSIRNRRDGITYQSLDGSKLFPKSYD